MKCDFLLASLLAFAYALRPSDACAQDVVDSASAAHDAEEWADTSRVNIEAFVATDTVTGVSGEVGRIGGNSHATVKVPEDMVLLDSFDARRLLELYWGNAEDTTVLGALVPAADTLLSDISVAFVFYSNEDGYVNDDDAADIDYDELLAQIKENTAQVSEELQKLGFPEQSLIGWAKEPSYDSERKILRWAKHIRFKYPDGDQNDVLNYDVRILGRKGYVMLQAIADMTEADAVIAMGDRLSTLVSFDDGYTYSDYDDDTDAVSDYTIGGLVAGSALLAKTGVLAKVGLFLVKAWKLILLAGAAVVGVVFKSRSRKKGEDDGSESATPEQKK